MSNSIRIRTTPNGSDKYVKVALTQEFDFIEILSLKISQEKAYQKFCSDYGVVVGRVIVNSGFGVPNAKVSVFIPLTSDDKENPLIKGLYPFEKVSDKDSDGIRYNLLPKESDSKDFCYTPIGTFSSKREVLDNPDLTSVYTKYYKYTTSTNAAGDFMIFGVPVGAHTIHVDADISNIGVVSQRPYDLIDQGVSKKYFTSPTKFKASKNLDSLVQVKTANIGVNVQPFWGDLDTCQIGISRVDFDLNYTVRPSAMFMGSIFGDSAKNSVNKNCRPRKKMGNLCETATSEGMVEMIRKTTNGDIESFSVDGGRVVDEDGTWSYQVPMNLDYMVTDEFGSLVLSDDENKGVPTRARVRFRIGLDESGGIGRIITRAKYLVPHNPKTFADRDFSFDQTTKDSSFTDLYWNKVYSVKNFIARIQNSGGVDTRSMLGMKDLDGCTGEKSPFPYNKIDTNFNPLYSIICIILTIITSVVFLLNVIICILRKIPIIGKKINPIKLTCPSETAKEFTPGCKGAPEPFIDCVSALIAEDLGLFKFDFYNDWINGSLYAYSLKYKKKRKGKEKFCEYDCDGFAGSVHNNKCQSKLLFDTCVGTGGNATKNGASVSILDGFISDYKGTLYYSPIIHNGVYKMYATDVINLGAVLDCDWQGIPTLHQYLLPTTFKTPPIVNEVDSQEVVCGMINLSTTSSGNGVFFSINCKGVQVNEGNCNNIRKICEFGTDIPSNVAGGVTDCNVGLDEIYDTSDAVDALNSVNRYMRNVFYGLNISGSSINGFSLPNNIDAVNNGTSFNINSAATNQTNGSAYNAFRNYYPANAAYKQPLGNSFFFYFGLMPGKTALDKMNAKYFTICEQAFSNDFIVSTTVVDNGTQTSNNGAITFNFIGGTPSYTYTWTGVNYSFGPVTTTTGGVISGLIAGDYVITVTDGNGSVVTKTVSVGGPQPLICYVDILQPATSPTSNDGKIIVQNIYGGNGPYTLKLIKPNTTTYTIPIVQGQIINDINIGENIVIISDSSSPSQLCSTTITMTGPISLHVELEAISSGCGVDGDGIIYVNISGGTAPYTISTTGPSGYVSDGIVQGNLNAGTYTTLVSDSNSQNFSGTNTISVIGVPVASIITTPISGGLYTYQHTVSGAGGQAPYTGTGVFKDNSATYTTTIIDATGCESNSVTG